MFVPARKSPSRWLLVVMGVLLIVVFVLLVVSRLAFDGRSFALL
jgi:hypothetical protein